MTFVVRAKYLQNIKENLAFDSYKWVFNPNFKISLNQQSNNNFSMHRLKIFVGVSLLVLTLLFLTTSSIIRPEPNSSADNKTLTVAPETTIVDKKAVRQFESQQQKLNITVEAYFKKAIAAGDIVGAGVSIVKGDSIVLSDGYGKRDINQTEKVNGETIFRLGSLSKGFAGVLAADLKSEGKLNWTDKVNDYLPEFQLGDSANTAKITLANIMSHTSGTPYHSFTNLVEAGIPMATIAKRFKEVNPISEPGELYSYQNAMFALSGEIMFKATGNEVTESLHNRFFKPLGMCTTNADYETLINIENVAMPHVRYRKGWRSRKLTDRYHNAIVAGGINASPHDMGRWMRFLLGHNPEVMEESAIAEAFMPQVEINIGRKYYKRWPGHIASYYAFGWRIHTFEVEDSEQQETVWHHGGSVNNYRNEIAMYPEADLGICVLLNSNSRIASTVIPDIHQIVNDVYRVTESESDQDIPESASSSSSL